MTIRFFILQAHYRGTVDFSNEALQASEKALQRMLDGYRRLQSLKASSESTVDVKQLEQKCYEAMDDDLNTPVLIANLFEACVIINRINDGHDKATAEDIETLKRIFDTFLIEVLGILPEGSTEGVTEPYEKAVDLLLEIRAQAKSKKDWATSDLIRDKLSEIGFKIKDTKDGVEWSIN